MPCKGSRILTFHPNSDFFLTISWDMIHILPYVPLFLSDTFSIAKNKNYIQQAGAELGQAQVKLVVIVKA